MARKTFPRREEVHRATADQVIARHERETGVQVSLPVPIEQIIESTFGLEILWDEINESDDSMILGALIPSEKRIVMNSRHEDLFVDVMGPERFTLAHELGHWVYDADDPNQLSLDLEFTTSQFCYYRLSGSLSDDLRVREINANKFASHVLLPDHLVRSADIDAALESRETFRSTARNWGVSPQTLRIRLEALGLFDDRDAFQLELD